MRKKNTITSPNQNNKSRPLPEIPENINPEIINLIQLHSEAKYRQLIENSKDIIYTTDEKGSFTFMNQAGLDKLGYSYEQFVSMDFEKLIADEFCDEINEYYIDQLNNNIEESYLEVPFKQQDGSIIWLGQNVRIIKEDENVEFYCIARDVTEFRNSRLALKESEKKYKSLYDNALVGMLTTRITDGEIISANEIGYKMFGYSSREDVINKVKITDKYIDPLVKKDILEKLKKNELIYNYETQFKKEDGSTFWGEITARIFYEEDKIEIAIIDISKRREVEEKIYNLTFYDQLTRLPNKDMLRSSIKTEIMKAEMKKQGNIFAVICLGIDNFKSINNLYGTSKGDILLKAVATRLKATVYEKDIVTRYDGDKFTIIFSEIASRNDAWDLVKKTDTIFTTPFNIQGDELKITSSMGVCLYPKDGYSPDILIKNSEAAMYIAKEKGITTQFFDAELNSQICQHFQLEKELKEAIENDEFIVYYQPKIGIINGPNTEKYLHMIDGMESLIRWESPKRGLVSPLHFISLAEKNGMIVDIGYDILKKACIQNKQWQDQGYLPVRVAVNLSPYQFNQPDLVDNIEKIIDDTGLNPMWLELEITETGIMSNEKESIEKLKRLRNNGFGIAIDDFGTGYSSLSKIQNYPIDTLKIDKSFIDNLITDEKTASITKYTINLAHDLGFRVVAEGVETKEQLDLLIDLNCDQIQGFYYSKPLPSVVFEEKLNNLQV